MRDSINVQADGKHFSSHCMPCSPEPGAPPLSRTQEKKAPCDIQPRHAITVSVVKLMGEGIKPIGRLRTDVRLFQQYPHSHVEAAYKGIQRDYSACSSLHRRLITLRTTSVLTTSPCPPPMCPSPVRAQPPHHQTRDTAARPNASDILVLHPPSCWSCCSAFVHRVSTLVLVRFHVKDPRTPLLPLPLSVAGRHPQPRLLHWGAAACAPRVGFPAASTTRTSLGGQPREGSGSRGSCEPYSATTRAVATTGRP